MYTHYKCTILAPLKMSHIRGLCTTHQKMIWIQPKKIIEIYVSTERWKISTTYVQIYVQKITIMYYTMIHFDCKLE